MESDLKRNGIFDEKDEALLSPCCANNKSQNSTLDVRGLFGQNTEGNFAVGPTEENKFIQMIEPVEAVSAC